MEYKISPDNFVAWLATQRNTHGTLFLERVARTYSRYLHSAPAKLDISLTANKRNVYDCSTVEEFDKLHEVFLAAPNFKHVNECGHRTFSAGLRAYRRYLENLEHGCGNEKTSEGENKTMETVIKITDKTSDVGIRCVDFKNTNACSGSEPVSCFIDNTKIYFEGNWRNLLVAITEYCILKYGDKVENLKSEWFSNYSSTPYLLSERPVHSAKKLTNDYWINVHYSISQLVLVISGVCRYCGINLNNVEIKYMPKASYCNNDETQDRNDTSSMYAQKNVRSAFKEWLTAQYPDWSQNTLMMHCSDAYYLYNNDRGVTLAEALTDGGVERALTAVENYFANNPTQTNNPSISAKGYIRSLKMLKTFLAEQYSNLTNDEADIRVSVPETILKVLSEDYPHGFAFDTTTVRLLSDKAGVDVNIKLQDALKRIMFRGNDNIYYLTDIVASKETKNDIISFADSWFDDYGCFEISELYALFADSLNNKCIDGLENFEAFYEFINRRDIRCVSYYGTRIARIQSKCVRDLSFGIATKVISIANDEYGDVVSEENLIDRFPAFSAELLTRIIKEHAEELVKVEINGMVCYQTLDALGLTDEFSDTLTETLDRIDELGLTPSEEILHTAISFNMGVNFKKEYNIPDNRTYRRLITYYYKSTPKREWQGGVFTEVSDRNVQL